MWPVPQSPTLGTGPPDLRHATRETAMSPQADTTPDTTRDPAPDMEMHANPDITTDTEPTVTLTDTRSKPITIEHETFGAPSDPAVLLVMGFGTQLLGWDADFCRMLAARGRYVIRYDNRDCGLSTCLDLSLIHI